MTLKMSPASSHVCSLIKITKEFHCSINPSASGEQLGGFPYGPWKSCNRLHFPLYLGLWEHNRTV